MIAAFYPATQSILDLIARAFGWDRPLVAGQ